MKIGDEFAQLSIDEDTLAHEWITWRVRSIQNRNTTPKEWRRSNIPDRIIRYVYAIRIESWTWSKSHGWYDPIPEWCRKKWRADEQPSDIFKTKKAAIKHELKRYSEYVADDFEDPTIHARLLVKLENMLKRA